jgi:hypothetical protein
MVDVLKTLGAGSKIMSQEVVGKKSEMIQRMGRWVGWRAKELNFTPVSEIGIQL